MLNERNALKSDTDSPPHMSCVSYSEPCWAGLSYWLFALVKSSYYSPHSKEPNPQQAEQGHAQINARPRFQFFDVTSPRIVLFCSSAECSSPSATASRRHKQRSSVQMKLVIFTLFFCSSAECFSSDGAVMITGET